MSKIDLGTNEFSAEEVKALYFDKDALIEPKEKLYRLDSKSGDRYYYKFGDGGKPNFYMSVTTFISKALPSNFFLIKWIAEMGVQRAEEYKLERAAYGTFLHGATEELTINRAYDLDKLDVRLKEYIDSKELSPSFLGSWYVEMQKDILAYAQFIIDHDVKPIAIEIMLASEKMGVAGALDLVCEMDWEEKGFWGEVYKSGARKDEPKETKKKIRIKAIVDTKSGKKGFYESHELQLHTYKMMFEENYPEHKIDKVFNWSGSHWRSRPDYKLKDQTGSKTAVKIPYYVDLAKIEADAKDEKGLLIVEGKIELDKGIEKNVRVITKEELVMSKQSKTK
ncbi:PD-(D/E)XK nuclease family protein [bacterium]|nr:PD-(D/E)XK nuclease family protein [bacterium]